MHTFKFVGLAALGLSVGCASTDIQTLKRHTSELDVVRPRTVVVYEFSNDFAAAGGGEPWESIHVARVTPQFTYKPYDRWSLRGGPMLEFSGETGAELASSLRAGASFAVGYQGDSFRIMLGLLAVNKIEDAVYIQPGGAASWNITEALELSLEGNSARGGDLWLGYTPRTS
jgi:hypothetical protein